MKVLRPARSRSDRRPVGRARALRRSLRHVGLLWFAGSVVCPPSVAATAEAGQLWQQQAVHVQDWLRDDARRALPDNPAASGDAAARPAAAPVAPPVLRALFGTHPDYTVLLEVDGRLRHYRPGASLPLNARSGPREFRLVRVRDRCVVLRPVSGGKVRTACYQASTEQRPVRSPHLLDQPLPGLASGR